MDIDFSDSSVFTMGEDESDGFVPEVKSKAKKSTLKEPPKKMAQTTLTGKAPGTKKRAKPESDDSALDDSDADLVNTPPSAKKQKKAPAPKKSSGKPFAEIENDSVAAGSSKTAGKKSASETYQKLTQLEHILKRPDTYIGSVERTDQQMWVYNKETSQMEHRVVGFVPGLYKIFDEILVNAADNKQRDSNMTYLKVTIDRGSGAITVENNGKGIPVEIHSKEKIYIPELVFGHLLAGSNFDDNEKKTVGGRNGYGAKLCNVFSTEFTLECQDNTQGKRYKQTWTENMTKMQKAKITSNKTQDFVRVTFTPDYQRFGMPDGIDDDLESLLLRRVYDMAGTVRGVKVSLNGEHIKVPNFGAYCEMYAKAIAGDRAAEEGAAATVKVEVDKHRVVEKGSQDRWEVAFAVSDGSFQQVSFVNSIATTTGGTHVNDIADQICQSLLKNLTKKVKGHSLKANHIRNHIFIFVNCLIENPAFTSQTKEQMTTKASAFGSRCKLSDKFLKKIAESDALSNIISFAEKKADKMLAKSDGSKRSRVNNAKLTEANLAGTRRGHECTLILTEGDSAKGLAVSGRAILDPDRIGVFPLRGKMLNVRDASIDQITKNQEIQSIKQILGLKHKQSYKDVKELRYGHLMIMADQDHDGSHIKGLLINFLQVQFPSLLQIPDFFREFITPIVKCWTGTNPKQPKKLKWFFTQPEYEEWNRIQHSEKWESKYLKGLGSSTSEDAQRYFSNLDDHLKEFKVMKQEESDLFELAFSKKKADARKEWLGNFVPGTYLDHSVRTITYGDFVNKELILFSMADNMRSIPSVLDGFKPGQRKVMYGCFMRNLVKDTKVYELSGFISEKTKYHHGDTSLQQTIIGLAQDFVGSNNVNVLEPSGNFGSRLAGGSDAASPRYIFTRLSPFARKVFSNLDEPVLDWQFEEGAKIEPKAYAPILPMVLANGADGIGTGWSTSIPNYHPIDLVNNLKRRMGRLDGQDDVEGEFEPMTPWFRGWKGTAEPTADGKFKLNGIAYQDENKRNEIIITELPIRTWTDDFKGRLEDVISGNKGTSWVKDYREFNDHNNVHFEVILDDKFVDPVMKEGILERFKLLKQIGNTNLVAFDTRGQIRKYAKVEDIMEEFYHFRLQVYTKRKAHWLGVLDSDYRKLKNQARFVQEIIDGELVVNKKKKDVLVKELRDRKYEAFPKVTNKAIKKEDDDEGNGEEEEEESGGARDYDYLLSMPIWSLTAERLAKLKDQIARKKAEHDELLAKSERDLWCKDLDDFVDEWDNQERLAANVKKNIRSMGRRESKKIGAGGAKGRGRPRKDDDDYEPTKMSKAMKAKSAKTVVKETKVASSSAKAFAERFAGAKKKQEPASSEAESDDLKDISQSMSRNAAKPADVKAAAAVAGRTQRAAAMKANPIFDDSESNDDSLLGDIGALVKGVPNATADAASGRLSLFNMNSQGGNGGTAAVAKARPKPSMTFDFDSHDDTNYEALARSSPHKSAAKPDKDDDDPFSDDASPLPAPKARGTAGPSAPKAPLNVAKKGRGRPAGTKNKPKDAKKPAAKPLGESPAAKAYAAKKKAKAVVISDDEEEDEEMADPDSPPPRPAGRGRPARSAAAARPKPTYDDDEDDEDEDDFMAGGPEDDDLSDQYELDDD